MEMEVKSIQDKAYNEIVKATSEGEKPRKPSPCAKKTATIHETLTKIQEQINNITIMDLSPVLEELNGLKTVISTLITLMERKVELDEKEAVILDLLKKNLEKG